MTRVEVKPALLAWARERSGLSETALAQRFPQLPTWVSGDASPTLKQLERFAKSTHTPIGYLFLAEPPIETVPIPDFRTIENREMRHPSPDLLDTIYICQQRQDWYRESIRALAEPSLDFVGSARIGDDVVAAASRIRTTLEFDFDQRRRIPTWTDALRRFIGQSDELGILVMVSGVVGSNNQRRLDPDEFRGFALVDRTAPLVFINGADSKAAQMFTLAHELAHIWLGESGISDTQAATNSDLVIEQWCNHVAAELLVPLELVRTEEISVRTLQADVERMARRFKVSTLVILRRAHDAGALSAQEMWLAYDAELERLRALPRGSGGDFYLTLGARVSKRFARALVASTLEGRTTFTESFRLLGLKKMATFHELGHSLGMGL